MNIIAIIGCRNEEPYLANCLRHLLDNDISFAVIDSESTDGTSAILSRPDLKRGLAAYQTIPFDGTFRMQPILRAKEVMAQQLEADWIIHLDADEIMHSSRDGENLHDAIARLSAEGANVVNFDEFVFLPVDHDYCADIAGHQQIRNYYFFEPHPQRLMRAWRKDAGLSMVATGGHRLKGAEVRLAPEALILRHYIFLSQEHAFRKYSERAFDEYEVHQLGWHGNRYKQPLERFRFPPVHLLKRLHPPESRTLSKAQPKKRHYWQWEPAQAEAARL